MSLTAFVTGASGFVGSHLVRNLQQQGWKVHLLARPSSSLEELAGIPFEKHIGDVTDEASIRSAMPKEVDGVFHVAASTNFWARNNPEQTRINVDGTRNMLEAAIAAGAGRFIHTSSFVAWGFTDREINEDSPRTHATDWINYVRTKHISEQMVLKAGSDRALDVVVLNPANVLGPGDQHNWSRLFRLIYKQDLPGIGPAGGNFCDVREVAKAHIAAFHKGRNGEKYLLGGEFASLLDVARMAGDILNKPTPDRPTPAWLLKIVCHVLDMRARITGKEPDMTPEVAEMISHDIVCDSGKAMRELDYRSVPLRDMIADTIEWMHSKGMLQ